MSVVSLRCWSVYCVVCLCCLFPGFLQAQEEPVSDADGYRRLGFGFAGNIGPRNIKLARDLLPAEADAVIDGFALRASNSAAPEPFSELVNTGIDFLDALQEGSAPEPDKGLRAAAEVLEALGFYLTAAYEVWNGVGYQPVDVRLNFDATALGHIREGMVVYLTDQPLGDLQSDAVFDKASELFANAFESAEDMREATLTQALAELDAAETPQTESGLRYRIVRAGDPERRPGPTSDTLLDYSTESLEGTVYDSSYARGTPARFFLNNLVAGFAEGAQLIGEGGEIELFVPPALAYGFNPPGFSQIQPNELLFFRIELYQVIVNPIEAIVIDAISHPDNWFDSPSFGWVQAEAWGDEGAAYHRDLGWFSSDRVVYQHPEGPFVYLWAQERFCRVYRSAAGAWWCFDLGTRTWQQL